MKREYARRYLNGEFSHAVGAEMFALPSRDSGKDFIKWFNKQLALDEASIASLDAKALGVEPIAADELPDDVATLQEMVRQERQEKELWRTVVRIAEEEHQLPVLKKAGAKQPSK